MRLVRSGLDCHRAPIALREQLAFSKERTSQLLRAIAQAPGVDGCVLLSTCNRTELYVTGAVQEPFRLLCQAAGVATEAFAPYIVTQEGDDAAQHLLEVACGLHSQILGENQIITQVRQAMELGQAAGTADAALAALFRRAVTAGKRARTEVSIDRGVPSMGTRCREVLAQELGGLRGRRILVIGTAAARGRGPGPGDAADVPARRDHRPRRMRDGAVRGAGCRAGGAGRRRLRDGEPALYADTGAVAGGSPSAQSGS